MGSQKRTAVSLIIGMATVTCVLSILFMSMSSKPFVLANELNGEWFVDPVQSHGRKQQQLQQRAIFALEGQIVREPLRNSLKITGPITIGEHEISGTMAVAEIRLHGAGWRWTGQCSNAHLCTLLINKHKILFSAVAPGKEGAPVATTYVLSRVTAPADESIWQRKGKFVVVIVVLIVAMKFFAMTIAPSPRVQRLEHKMRMFEYERELKRQQMERKEQERSVTQEKAASITSAKKVN